MQEGGEKGHPGTSFDKVIWIRSPIPSMYGIFTVYISLILYGKNVGIIYNRRMDAG